MADVRFTPNMGGIRSILKGSAVVERLDAVAHELAEEADSMAARNHATWSGHYEASTEQHRHVAVGKVSTDGTWAGLMDQSRNHTLNAINH